MDVAVKVLICQEESERFRLEASRLSSLSHQNIVSYYEVGDHNGHEYLVMECMAKGDLNHRVKGLSLCEILRVFVEICDGLSYLHGRGIIHRDLKPGNILFGADGRPKIADLGLSRHIDQTMQLTQAGAIVGSYSYLSPEQILSSRVGPSADLYSLGVCLFKALAGVRPFCTDNDFAMLKAHLHELPPSLRDHRSDAPDSLVSLVSELLAKDPSERPESATRVAERLLECLDEIEGPEGALGLADWERIFDSLEDAPRSILLVLAFLKDGATFEHVCCVSPYAEDKTDLAVEELLELGFIRVSGEDRFFLKIPRTLVEARLSGRLRRLYEDRFSRRVRCLEASRKSVSSDPVWLPESSFDEFETSLEVAFPNEITNRRAS